MKLTTEQYDLVNEEVVDQISEMLGIGFDDSYAIATKIIGEVIDDIEETADWGGLDDDEICVGDVRIAVGRIISEKLLNGTECESLELGGFIDRIVIKLLYFMDTNGYSPTDNNWGVTRKGFLEYLKQQANKQ